MTVVATAGHVDHGKSTLVRALTGTDPDRLPQEQARGMTLDLGFAAMTLPSGHRIAFVDVPGHERLVGTALMGVSPARACLFVVDAHEGWRAQSEEHLRILELLHRDQCVVALTKCGTRDATSATRVQADVTARFDRSRLSPTAVVAVDAVQRTGLDELCHALDRMVAMLPPVDDRQRPRLWVDRSFTIRGAGTIVTGTVGDGSITKGERLVLMPGNTRVRVRTIQEHGSTQDVARTGSRAALNLTGVASRSVHRGDALVRADDWRVASDLRAKVAVLDDAPPLTPRGAWSLHLGTRVAMPRIRVPGGCVAPGSRGTIRIRLVDGSLPIAVGDRFVLRDVGRDQTVAGGVVVGIGEHGTEPRPPFDARAAALEHHPFLLALRERPLPPPEPLGVPRADLGALRAADLAVSRDGFWFATSIVAELGVQVLALIDSQPDGVTVAQVRDELGGTRRATLALLGLLDARGVTIRHGDRRVADPRARRDQAIGSRRSPAQEERS